MINANMFDLDGTDDLVDVVKRRIEKHSQGAHGMPGHPAE